MLPASSGEKADLIIDDAKVNPAHHHDSKINVSIIDEDHTPRNRLKQTVPPSNAFFFLSNAHCIRLRNVLSVMPS